MVAVNVLHCRTPKVNTGPAGFFVSRIAIRAGERGATWTQSPLAPLWLLVRQVSRDGAGCIWRLLSPRARPGRPACSAYLRTRAAPGRRPGGTRTPGRTA